MLFNLLGMTEPRQPTLTVCYLLGWPVLQLASFFGLNALGLPLYLTIVLVVTAGLATASWYLVESRALRLKNISVPAWLGGRREPERDEVRV